MPIHGQCPGCGRKFQAPDHLAGKRVKCPKCAAAIDVPADGQAPPARQEGPAPAAVAPPPPPKTAEQPRWLVKLADGRQLGPMSRADLDLLVERRRLDGHCQIRREDATDWQWAETVYPQLIVPVAPDESDDPVDDPVDASADPRADEADASPLRPCPDCGKMTSRRASLCPNCGCPLSADERAHSALAPVEPAGPSGSHRGRNIGLLVAGLVGGVVLVCAVVAGVLLWFAGNFLSTQQAELKSAVDEVLIPEPPPPPPPEPGAAPPTAEQIAEWKDAAAANAARRVDDLARQVHQASTQVEGFLQDLETLSQIRDDPMGRPGDDLTRSAEAAPYESQYDALHQECFTYLLENLPAEGIDQTQIQAAADRWLEDKCGPLQEELRAVLPISFGF